MSGLQNKINPLENLFSSTENFSWQEEGKKALYKLLEKKAFPMPGILTKAKKTTLSKEKIKSHILPCCKKSHLVFVNGYFDKNLSDTSALSGKTTIFPLTKAVKEHSFLLHNASLSQIRMEKDPLSLLSLSAPTDGIMLHLPSHHGEEKKLQIIHYLTFTTEDQIAAPLIFAFLGKKSSLSLFSTLVTEGEEKNLFHPHMVVSLEEKAKLEYNSIYQAPSCFVGESMRTKQKRQSKFHIFRWIGMLQKKGFFNYHSSLEEREGEMLFKSASLVNGSGEEKTTLTTDHKAPMTISHQLIKNIALDQGKTSFLGRVRIRREAQKSLSSQKSQNILLSESATIHSRPYMEIFADDVKASHGVTISQLDEEPLFYLQSRGIDKKQAKTLLLKGFIEQLLFATPLWENFHPLIEKSIQKVLS